jgi:hypothetical protein
MRFDASIHRLGGHNHFSIWPKKWVQEIVIYSDDKSSKQR